MQKTYLAVLALLVFLAISLMALPSYAHGNKKHPPAASQNTTPAIENPITPPGQATDANHEATPHEHSATEAAHEEGAGAHEHGAGEEEEEGHSHWGDNGPSTPFEKFLAYLGNFHSLVVHFPIALFLTAALAQGLYLGSKKESYASIVRFSVWIAAFGALGAGLLGWAHAGPIPTHESTVMMSHRWIGTTLLLGGFATAFIMEASYRQRNAATLALLFNLSLFAMAIFVAINGFLGGALAHGGMEHLMPGNMMV